MGDVGDEIISLLKFKKKLADLGHFYTSYNNIDHLKLQFSNQLDKQLQQQAQAEFAQVKQPIELIIPGE